MAGVSHLSCTYNGVDPLELLLPDWLRFRAWKGAHRLKLWQQNCGDISTKNPSREQFATVIANLQALAEFPPLTNNRFLLIEAIGKATAPVQRAACDETDAVLQAFFDEMESTIHGRLKAAALIFFFCFVFLAHPFLPTDISTLQEPTMVYFKQE